jgi:hypothetical protein
VGLTLSGTYLILGCGGLCVAYCPVNRWVFCLYKPGKRYAKIISQELWHTSCQAKGRHVLEDNLQRNYGIWASKGTAPHIINVRNRWQVPKRKGNWVGFRAGLGTLEKRKISFLCLKSKHIFRLVTVTITLSQLLRDTPQS